MSPPHHPSTRSFGLTPPPFVEESAHEAPVFAPGRFAPTWLEDFITGELYTGAGKVGCTATDGPADSEDRRHFLLIKGHQSYQEGSSEPYKMADGSPCDEVYSCVCQNCRHHFTFYIWRSRPDKVSDASRKLCGLTRKNQDDPFHHLLPTESQTHAPGSINNKLYPFLGSSTFVCSAVQCPFKIAVEISGPRLTDEYLSVLCDKEKILERRRLAVETEPERFADVANIAPDALLFLRFYMRDIVEAKLDSAGRPDTDKKIDQRNKKFVIQFGNGPESRKLFTFLGFKEVVDGDKQSWRLPSPAVTRPTQPGSQLAFYQDIKSEIETIMGRVSQTLRPNEAISFITNALDFGEYPQSPSFGVEEYKAADYASLGLLPNMHESIFWWAFRCQAQTCPEDELRFFEAVERLAEGRHCDDLLARIQSVADQIAKRSLQAYTADQDDYELQIAKQMSLTEDPAPSSDANDVEHEYTYFGLPEGQRSDREVADKFRESIKSYPSQKSGYRTKLLKIARHRNNSMLKELAAQDMGLDEALEYLRVNRDTETSFLESTTQAYVNTKELDAVLASVALKVVGDSKSANEREYLYNVASTLMEDAVRLDPTLRTAFSTSVETVPLYLPVGLDNIRNTCYLNSILQYLFTVKEIRKIVLEYDRYALPNTADSLASRRIEPGQNTLSKAEAYAGRQFVIQLSILFQDLITSQEKRIRPPQRLALGALKNATQLETDGKAIARRQKQPLPFVLDEGTSSVAPPVPPRSPAAIANPPSSPNLPSTQHTEVGDVSDTISVRSSGTLVDLTEIDEDSFRVSATTVEVPLGYDPIGKQTEHVETVEHAEHAEHAENVVQPAPADETEEAYIDLGLNDSSVTGTDQQDVEEVMGNILSHLRAAIKATGDDPDTNMQTDPVTDTFYWTSATYTKKIGDQNYSRLVSPGRVMTAYPNDKNKVITLLQGLDMSFRREFITDNGLEQFTSIVKLPPILHIHIQRTTSTGGKNMTAIEIPQVLRLDQFMDCAQDSDLFSKRRRAWNLQERLLALTNYIKPTDPSESFEDMVRSSEYDQNSVQAYLSGHTAGQTSGSESELMEVDAASDNEEGSFVVVNDSLKAWMAEEDIEVLPAADTVDLTAEASQWASLPATSRFFEDAVQMTAEEMQQALVHEGVGDEAAAAARDAAKAIAETHAELASIFDDVHAPENEYVLHAVVCHGGFTGKSGHYWVWVYDFERCVWRRYNDSVVTQEADNDMVIRQLQSGEPYYLAYIRASEVDKLVNVQLRQEPPAPPPLKPPQNDQALMPPPPPPRPVRDTSEDLIMFPPPPTPPPAPSYDDTNAEYFNDQLRSYANAPPVALGQGDGKGRGRERSREKEVDSDTEMTPAQ